MGTDKTNAGRKYNVPYRAAATGVFHRSAAFLLALAAVLAIAFLIVVKTGSVANAAEGTEDVEYKYYTTVTVEKGDTLWDLALENYSEKYYDSVDDYIEEVKAINGLKSDTIHEGAKLVIVYFSSEYK